MVHLTMNHRNVPAFWIFCESHEDCTIERREKRETRSKIRQDKARKAKARQGKANKARQGKARETRQC